MAPISPEMVVERLGVRGALREYRYFVGRTELLLRLRTCVREGQRGAAWVHGPRRMGKSSLAARLLAEAPAATRNLWVDAVDLPPRDFDGLLARVVEVADEAFSGQSARERFESLARSSGKRPTAIVFDEFDRLAAELREDEQRFLRRLKEQYSQLSYVFVSRAEPSVLLEQVSDVSSRLSGVCQAIRVTPLEKSDVRLLFQRIADDLGRPELSELHNEAWRRCGGYPVALVTTAQIAAAAAVARGADLSDEDLEDAMTRSRAEVKSHLDCLWHDLSPELRSVLLQPGDPRPSDLDTELAQIEGFWSRRHGIARPTWLVEIGAQLGVAPKSSSGAAVEAESNVERLHALVYSINERLQRRALPKGFVTTDEVRRIYLLTRSDGTRDSLVHAVNHLSKVLYEAARDPREESKSRDRAWRLPPEMVTTWKRTDGYLELVTLRNYYDHDPERGVDEDVVNSRYANEGEVYRRHCGSVNPSNAYDWISIRDGLLASLVASLEALERHAG